jgi:hypothetical protein
MRKLAVIIIFTLLVGSIFADGIGAGIFEKSANEVNANEIKVQNVQTEFEIFRYSHNQQIFEWEFFTTKLLFWMTFSFVCIGIILSIIQFIKSVNKSNLGKDPPIELVISEKKIKIKSAYIGLILLIVSFAFLYLYMYTAYPIKYITRDMYTASLKK